MKNKSNAWVLRQFDCARARVDHLDAKVARLQQLRQSRHAIVRWWADVRSRVVIDLAIDARDDLIVYRKAARRRGLLNHRL
jgi:hypothetical protein